MSVTGILYRRLAEHADDPSTGAIGNDLDEGDDWEELPVLLQSGEVSDLIRMAQQRGSSAAAARPTDAASGLGRRRYLQSSAPSWRPDAIARVLVATIYRPGSPDRNEHRRGAAGHRLFDSCANISCRGRPVSSDLLVRPEECCATSIHFDCRMQRWAACRSDDTPARGLRNLPGGPWPCPPGLQAATGPETVATRFSSRVSAKGKHAR